jgi:hypothetical protein
MAVLSKQEFKDKWARKFADNTIQDVDEAMLRDFRQDIADSFADVAAISAPTAPDYDAGAIYPKGAVVLFGQPNKLFYQAQLPGLLPEPTPGVETAEWLPVAKPLSPLLPYLEMSAQQGRDFGSDGLLAPSTLYRFTGRVDAQGAALDDVLVVAVSRHQVAGADAYTIGLDPQTRQEYLEPVSYDLLNDETAPRAAGGGGGAGYTKDEADALLATKGSALVQTQHTNQLATLGAQAAPVMAYLADNSVAPFQTLGEALAFTAQTKVYMEFHAAVLELLVSGWGWPSFTNCTGTVVYFGEDVHLDLRGKTKANLEIRAARFYQKAGTFGGQVNVVSTATASAPPATLPYLDGDWAVPVNLNGRLQASGTYASLLGTGTVYAVEPFSASYLDPGVTVVRSGGGSALVPATTTTLGGLIVGPGLQVDPATGQVSLKIDSTTLGQRADGTLYVLTTSGNISPAATPTNLTAVLSNGGYSAVLTWDAKAGATLYQVYRSINGGPWRLLVGVPYNYYTDNSGDTGGGSFSLYRVTAANSLGESTPSAVAQAQ